MQVSQIVLEYSNPKEMERDVRRLGLSGWSVVSQSSYTPRKGCLRTIAGGGLFFNRKPITMVTYRRQHAADAE